MTRAHYRNATNEKTAMLDIHTEQVADVVIIECSGRLVRSDSAFALRDAVMSHLEARVIVVDLSRVSTIEGGGMGMLMFLERWAYDRDIRLKLFNPSRNVWERLQLANSLPQLEIATADEMQALLSGTRAQAAAPGMQ